MSTNTQQTQPIMVMGCTKRAITYRAQGYETVCLQSADHGMQVLNGFNIGAHDVIALDDVLEGTQAHSNLSDLSNYITSSFANGSTTLWFDPSGHGQRVDAVAQLVGVNTTVAQLVANGAINYIPDAYETSVTFGQDFTFRPDGLETADLLPQETGIGPQILHNFDPASGDVVDLGQILGPTLANVDLSDIGRYVTATIINGDTVLSLDPSGQGGAGTPFAVLKGIATTLNALVGEHALAYTASAVQESAAPNTVFTFRAAGMENAGIAYNAPKLGAVQLNGFSLAAGDSIGIHNLLLVNGITPDLSTVARYLTTSQSNGSTTLYFDPTGGGHGTAIAVFHDTLVTVQQLLAGGGITVGQSTPPNGNPGPGMPIVRGGCTDDVINMRPAGLETLVLQSAEHGEQVVGNFSAAAGDTLNLAHVLGATMAHANLSDIGKYITGSSANGDTTLYFDPTGQGHQGTPIALLKGVSTTVAQLVANHGIEYVPDRETLSPSLNMPFTFRPDGLETATLLAPPSGTPAQTVIGFDPLKGDVLELQNILNRTLANPNLSDVGNYIHATQSGGNTILSVDVTGQNGAGSAFAVLQGVNITLQQLLGDQAISFTPSPTFVAVSPGAVFTYRAEGQEQAVIEHQWEGTIHLAGFSFAAQDGLGLIDLFGSQGSQITGSNIGQYLSAVQSGGSTTLYYDKTGSGHGGGVAFATLDNVSTTVQDLMSHGALHW